MVTVHWRRRSALAQTGLTQADKPLRREASLAPVASLTLNERKRNARISNSRSVKSCTWRA
jgi:hypothetical protein